MVINNSAKIVAITLLSFTVSFFRNLWKLDSLQEEELFTIFNLELHRTARIIELMKKYADLPMDLADASLVILAENLGHGRIFSVDQRDFNTYRWKQGYPFVNLLF